MPTTIHEREQQPVRRRLPDQLLAVGFVLFTGLSLLTLYTVAHELGHALAGLTFGQTLTAFDVRLWNLNPHVTLYGSLSTPQQLMQIGAGSGLPLLLWAGFQLAAPRRASASLTLVKLNAALLVLSTLLPWMLIPLFALWGYAPVADDVTAFLQVSRLPPLLLAALALTLVVSGWLLFARTTPSLPGLWQALRRPSMSTWRTEARPPAFGLAVLVALAAVISAGAAALAAASTPAVPAPPADYAQVAAVTLSAGPYDAAVVAEFEVVRPDEVGVFIAVREVDAAYLDFQLHGPGGYRATLFHGEGYRARVDSSHWRANLPTGTYRLLLTASRSPGTAMVYANVGGAASVGRGRIARGSPARVTGSHPQVCYGSITAGERVVWRCS